MKQCSTQLAALMVVTGMSFCLAGEEKKCPPEGVELKPVNFRSLKEYKPLFDNWKQIKCYGELSCDKSSCAELTWGKADRRLYFHGSAYNESTNKPFATTGYLTMKKPGVFQADLEYEPFSGTFSFLLVKENICIVTSCSKANAFSIWITGKKQTLEPHEERLLEHTLTNNKLKLPLRTSVGKDCAKIKAGF